jgi:AcrR family transcriptional regulator
VTADPASSPARAALLEAARAELAEGGTSAVGLRAVARRAGLSHAAPAHFFGDRAGLLTAVATDGFRALTASLDAVAADEPDRLAALGRAYVEFGAQHPALVDLMFRGADLHQDDPTLQEEKRAAIGRLLDAVAGARDGGDPVPWTLISWALVHGLVVLGREGVLAPVAGRAAGDDLDVARGLIDLYAAAVVR